MLEPRWAIERPRRAWRWGEEATRSWRLDAVWMGTAAALGFFGMQAVLRFVA